MKTNKTPLGFFPTPLHELKHFGRAFPSYRVFIKRDDHTGLASGGNKTRKLEYLLGDALAQGADTVITGGAQQSNHCRQTAAACAATGLKCHLLLGGEEPLRPEGNLLLSKMLGATIHYGGEKRKGEDMDMLAEDLRRRGHRPYVIPYGGSNAVGAMGYLEASAELMKQLREAGLKMDYIYFATSSGGMQAGLTLGRAIYGLSARLMPVQIDKAESGGMSLEQNVRRIAEEGLQVLQQAGQLSPEEALRFQGEATGTLKGYDEAGYARMSQEEKQAILGLARTEGILLDPVYTARAFYAMTDHLNRKIPEAGSHVLFWHTGGLPANFSSNYNFF